MDTKHPHILTQEGINPPDYHGSLVFRSAIESIRGSYIASSMSPRQSMIAAVLNAMKGSSIVDYQGQGSRQRYDFHVVISDSPKHLAALEVKGGEGNSINISERPVWADEFVLWCHLDGAIKNQPAAGAGAIIFNRVSNELVKRGKVVDALIIRDRLCGTQTRPCPKYPHGDSSPLGPAPCVFLFPQRMPSLQDPSPPVHSMKTLKLPFLILDAFGVSAGAYETHVYEVAIRVFQTTRGLNKRETTVSRKGHMVETRTAGA
jgi:hypothetical protein